MLIIVAKRQPNAIVTEYVVDNLYGDGPEALVARMIMHGAGIEDLDDIRAALRKRYPDSLAAHRKSTLSSMVYEVKKAIDRFMEDGNNLRAMSGDLGAQYA